MGKWGKVEDHYVSSWEGTGTDRKKEMPQKKKRFGVGCGLMLVYCRVTALFFFPAGNGESVDE